MFIVIGILTSGYFTIFSMSGSRCNRFLINKSYNLNKLENKNSRPRQTQSGVKYGGAYESEAFMPAGVK